MTVIVSNIMIIIGWLGLLIGCTLHITENYQHILSIPIFLWCILSFVCAVFGLLLKMAEKDRA